MDDYTSIKPDERLLIQSLIDGTITEAESTEVNELLRNDSLLRAFYIDQVRIDSHLQDYHTKAIPFVLIGRHDSGRHRTKIISIAAASIAAGIAATVTFMSAVKPDVPDTSHIQYSHFKSTPNPMPLARITGIEDVDWSESTGGLSVGTWLSAGKLEIETGLIEITYDSGTSVILKGPAAYYIEENNRGFLESGTLRAHNPKTVAQFEIETSNTKLVNFGTSFGMTASTNSNTAIHVIKGHLRAQASGESDPQWRDLYAGDAIEIAEGLESPAKYNSFAADENQFDWSPKRHHDRPEKLNYLHWSFDDFDGLHFPESGSGFSGVNYPAMTRDFNQVPSENVWTTYGKYGQALEINTDNRFLETEFAGIEGHHARTVAFWVKYDGPVANIPKKHFGSVIAWGKPERGKLWKVALRNSANNRKSLTARTEVGWGNTAGSTTLNDGEWHHVVSVFTGGKNSDAGANVLHYVDGKLEKRSLIMSRSVDTSTDSENHYPVCIGLGIEVPASKNIESLVSNSKLQEARLPTFKGQIDELFLFNAALTPDEIIRLMETNTPPK